MLILDAVIALILYFLLTGAGPASDYLWRTLHAVQGLLWTVTVAIAALALVALTRLADRRPAWQW